MDITFNTIITNPGKYLYYQYCTGTKHIYPVMAGIKVETDIVASRVASPIVIQTFLLGIFQVFLWNSEFCRPLLNIQIRLILRKEVILKSSSLKITITVDKTVHSVIANLLQIYCKGIHILSNAKMVLFFFDIYWSSERYHIILCLNSTNLQWCCRKLNMTISAKNAFWLAET